MLKYIRKSAQDKETGSAKKELIGSDPSNAATAESVWLVLTTKKHIIPQPRLKPGKILLPNPLNTTSNLSICLITPDPQRSFKDLIAHTSFPSNLSKCINRVIDIKKLKAKYQSYESRKALRDSHDIFLADDRIVTYLSKTLGKDFYSSSTKRPIPIRLEAYRPKKERKNAALPSTKPKKETSDPKSITTPEAAAKEIERTLLTTQVYLSPSVTTSIRVGLSSHSPQQLAENIEAVVQAMTQKHVPRQWRGIQSIHIKGPNTMSLPIWLASELWADEEKVIEDDEAERLQVLAIESKKKKKHPALHGGAQLALKDGTANDRKKRRGDDAEQAQGVRKKKRKVAEEDFSQEMKERREKLREQKRKIQSTLEAEAVAA